MNSKLINRAGSQARHWSLATRHFRSLTLAIYYLLFIISSAAPAAAQTLIFWVKADQITGLSDGDEVTVWHDQSGNSYDASQVDTYAPVYKVSVLNGLPVVRWAKPASGNLELLQTTGFSLPASATVFLVGNSTLGSSGYDRYFDSVTVSANSIAVFTNYPSVGNLTAESGGGAGISMSITPSNLASEAVLAVNYTSTVGSGVISYNGAASTGNLGAVIDRGISLGGSSISMASGQPHIGDIAEYLLYSSLTTVQRQLVEGYLAWKWGLQSLLPSGHPWASSAPSWTPASPFPNAYNGAISETYTASDALAGWAGRFASPSETHTASDSLARLAGYGRAENETNTASDSVAVGFTGAAHHKIIVISKLGILEAPGKWQR